jgi:FkbM family methyltransferase
MTPVSHLERIRGHTICTTDLNSESSVIDAGAHRGEFSQTLMERYKCKCHLVEANPELAAQLTKQNFACVLAAALSGQDGHATFIKRKNLEAGGIIGQAQDAGNGFCEVKTISLATLIRTLAPRHIDLLKLDIEGSEFNLFEETADEVLCSISQITVEFHDFLPEFRHKGQYKNAKTRLEALGFLSCCMTFRTHGDVLFLNRKVFATTAFSRLWLQHGSRWLGKLNSP